MSELSDLPILLPTFILLCVQPLLSVLLLIVWLLAPMQPLRSLYPETFAG